MGTFSLWCSSRSKDKVKGYWRSNCYSYGCHFLNCSCMNRFAPITTKLGSYMHYGNLHVMKHFKVTWQGQRSLEVKLLVIWLQIVIVMVALFQTNLDHICTMGTFMLWQTSRSHDKVKGHCRSNCYSYGCPFSNCSCMNRFTSITTKLES